MLLRLLLIICLLTSGVAPADRVSAFAEAIDKAESLVQRNNADAAWPWIQRALERDPNARQVWDLRARWAKVREDLDEEIYARHVEYRLAVAQKAERKELDALRKGLIEIDPMATDLLDMRVVFTSKLLKIAEEYEKEKRPHSAIRVHQKILAIDPEREESRIAIERISAAPDPSLAETAKPKDLLEDVSEEWMIKHDEKHSTWQDRASVKKENYITHTDAGFEVLVRSAEAMEQMNAFYRRFFQYGTEEDGRSVSRIELKIFKNRDEYLKLGSSPAEWSGGQFTGGAVETYIGDGGFEGMVGTLFHEAAHQFVGLATSAVGWLNEGLASFFEGCRILNNGTVLMNMPATGRLMPLASRMERGWMESVDDGIDGSNPSGSTPERAPTFRIILENRYAWGPPWYAPTWGLVYFLYNYQDEVDGRFIYRASFREFINKSSGRMGEGAVENFEEVVLQNPTKPTKGVESSIADLPKTVRELDPVWKAYILRLRDIQTGQIEIQFPYLEWARYATERKEHGDALEHFEKGYGENRRDIDLLLEFGGFLVDHYKDNDRAARLAREALQVLEWSEEFDEAQHKKASKLLSKWDPKERAFQSIQRQLLATAKGLAQRYLDGDLPMMAMDVSWRLGKDLGFLELFDIFEDAVRRSGKSLAYWRLAYNETDLEGWDNSGQDNWIASGRELRSEFGEKQEGVFNFRFLTFDQLTSGDFSFEAEVLSDPSRNSFCGLVFGLKDANSFHGVILHPGQLADAEYGKEAKGSFLDLTSFYGGAASYQIHRHNPVAADERSWHKIRLDVIGRTVDVWFDDQYVVTHEFPNLQVLRGRFGLMTGTGRTTWRNIRYLARDPFDPAGRLERDVILEGLKAEAAKEGKTLGDSYVGVVPPFPKVKEWVQQPIESWDDLGNNLVMLVFWSITQNEQLPLHNWLNDVLDQYGPLGIKIVSVAAVDDGPNLKNYLLKTSFPGSVASDVRRGVGYGETFEKYLIHKFNMPRVLLLGLDHTVVWEGDPGMERGKPWTKGVSDTFVDTPLEDYVRRNHLQESGKALEAWDDKIETLMFGDLESFLPTWEKMKGLKGSAHPRVKDLQRKQDIVESAVIGIESTAQSLQRQGGEAALPTLLRWAELLGTPVPSTTRKALKAVLSSPNAKSWSSIAASAEKIVKKYNPSKPERSLKDAGRLLTDLESSDNPFAATLRERLQPVVDAENGEQVFQTLEQAKLIPGEWLLTQYFQW